MITPPNINHNTKHYFDELMHNKNASTYQFSKSNNFYLRLLRLFLIIRFLGAIALILVFQAPYPVIVYAIIIFLFSMLNFSKHANYQENKIYVMLFFDFAIIVALIYFKYNFLFFIVLSVLSAAIFTHITFIASLMTVYSCSLFLLKSSLFTFSQLCLVVILLLLITTILYILNKQQKEMYSTVAHQACQSALQQATHVLMVKDITDGIILLSKHGEIIATNNAAANILGIVANTANITNQHSNLPVLTYLLQESIDRIPKTIWLENYLAYAHFMPINHYIPNIDAQLRWLDWLKPFIHTDLIEAYLINTLSNSTLIQIEREQKYIKEAQKDKLASMGHMVAAVAHEIRNPLAILQQANDVLFEQIEECYTQQKLFNSQDYVGFKKIIDNNIQRMNDIISNILNVSKPANDLIQLNLNQELHTIVHDWCIREDYRLSILTHHIPEKPIQILFTPIHLRQIIENLLDNALRFCSKTPMSMALYLRHHPNYAQLIEVWILNDGASIDSIDQTRLFEPFFSKSSPTHTSQGVGLGLHIVRMLCMQNKATIEYAKNIDIPHAATHGFVIRFKKNNEV
jgi:signal transduction histidine kinase